MAENARIVPLLAPAQSDLLLSDAHVFTRVVVLGSLILKVQLLRLHEVRNLPPIFSHFTSFVEKRMLPPMIQIACYARSTRVQVLSSSATPRAPGHRPAALWQDMQHN